MSKECNFALQFTGIEENDDVLMALGVLRSWVQNHAYPPHDAPQEQRKAQGDVAATVELTLDALIEKARYEKQQAANARQERDEANRLAIVWAADRKVLEGEIGRLKAAARAEADEEPVILPMTDVVKA